MDFQATTDCIIQDDKNVVIQNLRVTAIHDGCCGQLSIVERKILSAPKKESTTYAIATNIVGYNLEGKNGKREENLSGNSVKRHENLISTAVPLKKVRVY